MSKCNYTYDALLAIFIALESRQVSIQARTMEEVKESISDFRLLMHILKEDKKLAQTLKEEGLKAMEPEIEAKENE